MTALLADATAATGRERRLEGDIDELWGPGIDPLKHQAVEAPEFALLRTPNICTLSKLVVRR